MRIFALLIGPMLVGAFTLGLYTGKAQGVDIGRAGCAAMGEARKGGEQ